VTISDPTPPSVTTSTGDLVEPGYHRGVEGVTFGASDVTGIQALRVYIDGTVRSTSALECDYTYVVPCANPGAQTLNVDLSALPDGQHTVEVDAVDAAGNETKSGDARTIVVDATAPATPSGLVTSVGGGWQASRGFSAAWSNPGGQVAPVSEGRWALCPGGSLAGCVVGTQPVSGAAGAVNGLQLPGEGAWTLTVQLVDAAGNTNPVNMARTAVLFDATPPAAPQLALGPRADGQPAVPATFAVPAGQVAPVVEARWALCPQGSTIGCRTAAQAVVGASGSLSGVVVPSEGAWELQVRLVDAAGNVGPPASATLRYLRGAAAPAPPATRPAAKAAARLRVLSARRSATRLVVRGSLAPTATGRVTVRVRLGAGARAVRVQRRRAVRDGRFTVAVRLSRTAARRGGTLEVRYAGDARHSAATVHRRLHASR
jgi:hypothetical protein